MISETCPGYTLNRWLVEVYDVVKLRWLWHWLICVNIPNSIVVHNNFVKLACLFCQWETLFHNVGGRFGPPFSLEIMWKCSCELQMLNPYFISVVWLWYVLTCKKSIVPIFDAINSLRMQWFPKVSQNIALFCARPPLWNRPSLNTCYIQIANMCVNLCNFIPRGCTHSSPMQPDDIHFQKP